MNTGQRFADGDGEQGVCPVCGSINLEYAEAEADAIGGMYPWKCEDCGAEGNETYEVTFSGHYNKT